MGIRGVLEAEVDIKSSGDLFHELFGKKPHHVSNITPDKVHACELHEGEFGKHGSIINWHYTIDGERRTAKELVEEINEEKKMVKLKVLDGHVTQHYKSITVYIHVIPKGEVTGVKWAIEFEKLRDDGPYPSKEMDLFITISKDIEAHHLKA